MKKNFILGIVWLLLSSPIFAQVGINADGSSPNPSAGLDVNFSDKGFLLPRLTMTQRDAIASPPAGLMVYCTDCGSNGSVCVYSNGAWRTFSLTFPAPVAGTNVITPGQIIWSWNAVPDATGYKWHTVNDYSTAIDMGSSLIKTESGIACNVVYERYVWAYNSCSVSVPVTLTETTSASSPATPAPGPHISGKTQITWNWTSVADATGYKWSSVNNFATATDMGMFNSKTETSLTCQTSYTRYAWAYNGCGYSAPVTLTKSTLDCWLICGDSLPINHLVSGGVAPVNKSVTYGTVNNIPGETSKCWITSNLGASHQATAVNDATEASAGWYWQFSFKQGYKHDGSVRTPNTSWAQISWNSDWPTANDPCSLELGSGWRVPTYTELYNIYFTGGWNNWNGPWNSALKIHAAGHIDYNMGLLYNRGVDGYYWSSIQNSTTEGWSMGFWNSYCGMYGTSKKANGFSVRCLK